MEAATRQRLDHTKHTVRSDLTDFAKGVLRGSGVRLDEREATVVRNVRRDGFAVVEGYWSRERALAMRDQLEAFLADGESKDYPEGAYLRFWDDRSYDQGVRRLYHVERVVPELVDFRNDPFVMKVVHAYYRRPFHSNVLVYQHNTRSNHATRYYHVDAFQREFKAFLYLDDVDESKGPFTYLRGTHRSHLMRLRKQIAGNEEGSPTSFYDEDLGRKLRQETKLLGSAGTLILADVRGLHRGSPQLGDSRSALVNYILSEEEDRFIDR